MTVNELALFTDVLKAHYAAARQSFLVFGTKLDETHNIVCGLVDETTMEVSCSDALYVFPTREEFANLVATNAIENTITREAKRIEDFRETNVNLRLGQLVIIQAIDPTVRDLSDAISWMRPRVEAASLNPVNRAILNLPAL